MTEATPSHSRRGLARRLAMQALYQWLLNEANGEPTDLAQNLLLVAGMEYVKEVEAVMLDRPDSEGNADADASTKQDHAENSGRDRVSRGS